MPLRQPSPERSSSGGICHRLKNSCVAAAEKLKDIWNADGVHRVVRRRETTSSGTLLSMVHQGPVVQAGGQVVQGVADLAVQGAQFVVNNLRF